MVEEFTAVAAAAGALGALFNSTLCRFHGFQTG